MKIAYIFMQFPVKTQTFAVSDMRALQALGHDVKAYALRTPGQGFDGMIRLHGLEDFPMSQSSGRSWRSLLSLGGVRMAWTLLRPLLRHSRNGLRHLGISLVLLPRMVEVLKELQKDAPDVVHVFWGHYPSLVLFGVEKVLPQAHRSIFVGAYDLYRGFRLTPVAANRAHSVWTHAACNVSELEGLGIERRKVSVSHRGLPVEGLTLSGLAREPGLICTAANFEPEKKLDLVIRAFGLICQKHPQARLVLMGDGAERAALEALTDELGLRDRITFTGIVSRAEVFETFQRADIFLFLSQKPSERLPNALKEAMLAGAYCMSLRSPGLEELMNHEGLGQILESTEPSLVAEALDKALSDPDHLRRVGEAARHHIETGFTAEISMRIYAEAWAKPSPIAFSTGEAVSEGA